MLLGWLAGADPQAVLAALLVAALTMLALRLWPAAAPHTRASAGRRGAPAPPRAAASAARQPAGETLSPFSADVARVYQPFSTDAAMASDDVLVVDCTHPSALTLTHHKASRNPPLAAVPGSDTSTGLVLNALRSPAQDAIQNWMTKPKVRVRVWVGGWVGEVLQRGVRAGWAGGAGGWGGCRLLG